MGKVYLKELSALREVVEWANGISIEPLSNFVTETASRPLMAVGSGGSATVCHLTALLHRQRHHILAYHTTPLDVLVSEPGLGRCAICLVSASGKNRDVLAAMKACVAQDAPAIATICMQRESPLAKAAHAYARSHVFEADIPTGRDGFLATNTLLATAVVLARAYGFTIPDGIIEPIMQNRAEPMFHDRHMVQVLYGGWGAPVATDLESKLSESALAAAQVSDYRNFGHGRHLWLARRAEETVVVAIVTPDVADLADRTLALFPAQIPVLQLRTDLPGPAGTVDLLAKALILIGEIAQERGFDPGRPHVVGFGRRLYHLSPPDSIKKGTTPVPVLRKIASLPWVGLDAVSQYTAAFTDFGHRLSTARIGGVVLDYDGTLCRREDRFHGLRKDIALVCQLILEQGLWIGIATGRGRSVRMSLQQSLPRSVWDRVIVAYYNGAELALLKDDTVPNRDAPLNESIADALEILQRDSLIQQAVELTPRAQQISIEPTSIVRTDALVAHVMTILAPLEQHALRVVASTHSVDVLAPGVSKLAIVHELQRRLPDDIQVLCIGDRGIWPGNDFALLAHPLSLSVDEVSSVAESCWNLAPIGVSGPDATSHYLTALKIEDNFAHFQLLKSWGKLA